MGTEKFKPLSPEEAIDFFRQKGFHIGFDWRDTEPAHHQTSFTMAKITQMNVLEDIRDIFAKGQKEGLPPNEIAKQLKTKLTDKGWWGEKELVDPVTGETKTVSINPHRIKRAYNINLATAHSEGKWQRIQSNKKFFPYLRYDGCNSANSRRDHCDWDGLVLHVDDPFIMRHMPIKEPGCKCWVKPLTRGQAEQEGIDEAPPETYQTWVNQRTGETRRIPEGVHPMFNYPLGGWHYNVQKYAQEKATQLTPALQAGVALPQVSVAITADAARDGFMVVTSTKETLTKLFPNYQDDILEKSDGLHQVSVPREIIEGL